MYRLGFPSCSPLTPICLAYPAPHLTSTTRLFPPHGLWSHTGAGYLLHASLLRVSVSMSLLSPLLWKQVTGSIHLLQTRSNQGFLQPSWCLPNYSSIPVLSLCIILSSFLIRRLIRINPATYLCRTGKEGFRRIFNYLVYYFPVQKETAKLGNS